jgi:hypothetical protein
MIIRTAVSALAALVLTAGIALAAPTPTPMPSPTLNPQPQGTEIAFVTGIQKDLMARFPTSADAVKAGYFRFGNEDADGAISYANLQWQSADPQHPSQLWYDAKGNLLGADFSVLQSSSMEPPKLWGVDFGRWTSFRGHIHYVLSGPNGTETYGGMSMKKFVAAGGDVNDPGAKALVAALAAAGKPTTVAAVKKVFLFPSIWDLIVWVKPNPNGAFADKNPLVTPSAAAEKDDM